MDYSALAQLLNQDAQKQAQQNPWMISANNISQADTGNNFGATALKGLLSGISASLGERSVERDTNARNESLRGFMSAAPEARQSLLQSDQYLKPHAATVAALELQAQQDRAKEIQKMRDEVAVATLKDEAGLPLWIQKQRLEGQLNPRGTKVNVDNGLGTEALTSMGNSKAVIDEALSLSKEIADADPSYYDIKGALNFTALDDLGYGQRITNLVDMLGKSRSGASLNKQEEKLYSNILRGDFTAGAKDISRLLEKLAQAEARRTKSRVEFTQKLKSGGALEELDSIINQAQQPQLQPKAIDLSIYSPEQKAYMKSKGMIP